MYFWKIEKLKQDIRENSFNEKDRFLYACIYIALGIVFMKLAMFYPVSEKNIGVWGYINTVSNVLVSIAGTFFAYKANGGASGKDFLGRFFGIHFVVSIRFFVLLIIPVIFVLVSAYMNEISLEEDQIFSDEELAETFFDFFFTQMLLFFFYFRICKHMRDVKNS